MAKRLNHSFPAELRLTRAQRDSLRGALSSARSAIFLTEGQRQVVREICHAVRESEEKPEQCLIAFKVWLFEAANALQIPPGSQRTTLLERFVSQFIEDMYRPEAAKPTQEDNRWASMSGITPAGNRGQPGAHP